MELDYTQLASQLGIAGPLLVFAFVILKRIGERFVSSQDRMVEALSEQVKILAMAMEMARESRDRMTRIELRLNRLRHRRVDNPDEDTDPHAA